MKGKNVKCPVCGTMNKSLFLEETEGTYECDGCGHTGFVEGYRRVPVSRIHIKGKKERLTPLPV